MNSKIPKVQFAGLVVWFGAYLDFIRNVGPYLRGITVRVNMKRRKDIGKYLIRMNGIGVMERATNPTKDEAHWVPSRLYIWLAKSFRSRISVRITVNGKGHVVPETLLLRDF